MSNHRSGFVVLSVLVLSPLASIVIAAGVQVRALEGLLDTEALTARIDQHLAVSQINKEDKPRSNPSLSPTTPSSSAAPRQQEATARVDCHGDSLPAHALARMGTVRQQWYGPLDFIKPKTFLAFLPDNKTLISRGKDGHSYLWDVTTGKFLRKAPDEEISQLSGSMKEWEESRTDWVFSPDGKLLANVEGKIIRLWNVATCKEIRQLQLKGKNASIYSVAFSPDGETLAAGGVVVGKEFACGRWLPASPSTGSKHTGLDSFVRWPILRMGKHCSGDLMVVSGM